MAGATKSMAKKAKAPVSAKPKKQSVGDDFEQVIKQHAEKNGENDPQYLFVFPLRARMLKLI